MASVMGLRRRVPVNSPTPSPPTSSKRSRSENNNNPSHGNLNSLSNRDESTPAKKSRAISNSVKNSMNIGTEIHQVSRGRGSSKSRLKSPMSAPTPMLPPVQTNTPVSSQEDINGYNVLTSTPWSVTNTMTDASVTYGTISGIGVPPSQTSLCTSGLAMPTPIPYMATSMATFVGTATNLNKNSSVSYLDISNMTSGSLGSSTNSSISTAYGNSKNTQSESKSSGVNLPFSGVVPTSRPYTSTKGTQKNADTKVTSAKFQNDTMFNTYQPWVIKTYGDLAKTKTITIKKYARILRTLRGEEVNSAENSKFRFWVKSKGFHIGQPEGYDAKPADRIIGRHAVTSPGLDPPLYVPTQLPHNKALSNSEGAVPPGRVYKKVAIVENFFDIIHAVHVDLEGRPGKHAGQKRTYRTITETYAFLPREAVTRFLLGCTECQRRPRTPSPTNLVNQTQNTVVTPSVTPIAPTTASTAVTPLSPTPAIALSASPVQTNLRPREASNPPESKSLFNYRHAKPQRTTVTVIDRIDKNKEIDSKDNDNKPENEKIKEKYNPLSITNILKKESPNCPANITENSSELRRTPESDRASSRSSLSSKRRRMLPEGRTPSPSLLLPLSRPWSPGLDPKDTPVDYSLPITTTYLKHQQRIEAEKNKAAAATAAAAAIAKQREVEEELTRRSPVIESIDIERDRFSPAAGLIDTNLNLLATIQQLHCQVMLALTERLRPSVLPSPLILPSTAGVLPSVFIGSDMSIPTALAHNHS